MATQMKIGGEEVTVELPNLDWLIGVGLVVGVIAQSSIRRPDLEFRIHQGMLEVAYRNDHERVAWTGWVGAEPTLDDWRTLLTFISTTGVK